MNDREWLSKVVVAAKVFRESELCTDPDEVEQFVIWLFNQYGIVYKDINRSN